MSQPYEIFGMADNHDDDAQVLGSQVTTHTANLDYNQVREPIIVRQFAEPKTATRLLSGTQLLDDAWTVATMILPEDLNRVGLVLQARSPSASTTDSIRISDGTGASLSGGMLLNGMTLEIDEHTGPVYAVASSLTPGSPASADMYLIYWAVSR